MAAAKWTLRSRTMHSWSHGMFKARLHGMLGLREMLRPEVGAAMTLPAVELVSPALAKDVRLPSWGQD